ncbi:hypothetical protein CF640_36660, partial [Burkholderia pseudomallei]
MPAAMFDAYVAPLARLASDAAVWARPGDIALPSGPPVACAPPAAGRHLAAGAAAPARPPRDGPLGHHPAGAPPIRDPCHRAGWPFTTP